MRVAFLCKRRYMSKDVILDRYARLYEFPRQLALSGHDVLGLCLDYRGATAGCWQHEAAPGSLTWESWSAGRLMLPGLLAHMAGIRRRLGTFRPDVVVSASDVYHVVLGHWLARSLGVPHVVDLYDNYESFGLAKVPLLRGWFRRAVAGAAAVSCVSAPLARRIAETCRPRGLLRVIESTIGEGEFAPADREASRAQTGLPVAAKIIGYAGALDTSRGIEVLYRAFSRLATSDPALHLALAGPVGRPGLPTGERVHYLGMLPHADVAAFYAALDVGVICVRDSEFGRYSFPQKAYEMLSVRVPLAVARVGAMEALFSTCPGLTYAPESDEELAAVIARQLASPVVADIPVPSWKQQATVLGGLLAEAVGTTPRR